MKVPDLLPFLPERTLNLWAGLQNLYLFTFVDRQIDRAGRLGFRWQDFRIADVTLRDPRTGESVQPTNRFQLQQSQPAIEINGLLGPRLYYGLGIAQGATSTTADNNEAKDVYYKVRYKLGGLALDGQYSDGGGPVPGGGGQLLDRSITIEHIG